MGREGRGGGKVWEEGGMGSGEGIRRRRRRMMGNRRSTLTLNPAACIPNGGGPTLNTSW